MVSLRVVIGDDHGLVRSGVRALLAGRGMDVVGEAADGRALVSLVRATRPDVAVVDVSMPLLDGLEATRRIARAVPETRVVMLTMHDDERFVARAREAGAAAYVLKDAGVDELIAAVSRVAAGERLLGDAGGVPPDGLTEREREVLRLVVEGRKNVEIAGIMNRSVHTVRSHRARLMRKLGIHNAADWACAAERVGIVVCGTPPKEARDRVLTPPKEARDRVLTPPKEARDRVLTPPKEARERVLTPPKEARDRVLTPPKEARDRVLTPPKEAR